MSACSVEGCSRSVRARGWCSTHYARWSRNGDPSISLYIRNPSDDIEELTCTRCHATKSVSDFPRRKNSLGYLRSCKSCYNEKQRKYSADKEGFRRYNKERAVIFRLGEEALPIARRMWSGEACEACGEVRARMAVDHDHSTGVVRGLLCINCNVALGLLEESPERFYALLNYLNAHVKESTNV